MFSLEGKLALVTGGAGSVGRAICLALAEAGADLVIVDTRRVGAENTAEKVRAFRRFTLVFQIPLGTSQNVVGTSGPERVQNRSQWLAAS